MQTLYINMCGGACAGKSTVSAEVFARLKKLGVNCELVTEYPKDCVWDESYKIMDDLIFVFGNQYHRCWRLNGKVDIVLVDSPLPLYIIYNKHQSKYFEDFIIESYNGFNNKMYFIERNDVFSTTGRVHSLEESKRIDNQIKTLLNKHNIPFVCYPNEVAAEKIFNETLKYLIKENIIAE